MHDMFRNSRALVLLIGVAALAVEASAAVDLVTIPRREGARHAIYHSEDTPYHPKAGGDAARSPSLAHAC